MHAALLVLMLTSSAAEPCLKPGDDPQQVETLPDKMGLELVGVAANFERGAMIVVRFGRAMGQSKVYRLGEKIRGRLEIVSIGANSALLRDGGRFYTVKLKGRGTKDWRQLLSRLKPCSGPSAKPR